ncbi:MAG: hypothetical protein ACRDZ8_17870 [Acidimicrobiales bacterium]
MLKRLLGALSVLLGAGMVGLLAVPLIVDVVVIGQIQQAASLEGLWDVPPAMVPALQTAGQQAGIPWFLLAAVASVATDYGQGAPDGIPRGASPGTSVFPTVIPPIVGAGQGIFLVTPASPAAVGPPLVDPEDVALAAGWLAHQLAVAAEGSPLVQGPLGDPAVAGLWQGVLASAPLAITAIAASGSSVTPASPGTNPIQQFGAAVLTQISAPITATNLGAFSAWAAGEGSCARFNPLATTQPEAGATPFNTLTGGGHVWNYPSFEVGVGATVTALTNGRYPQVIEAFRADAGVDAVASAVEESPWGTQHFGSTSFAGVACSDDGPGASGQVLPTATGPQAVDLTIVARAAIYQQIWDQAASPGS